MRFIVALKPLEKKIPMGNRIMCLSIIKGAIKNESNELYQELFFYGEKKNKKIKPFSFAMYLKDFKAYDTYININGELLLTISTIDQRVGMTMFNGLLNIKEGSKEGIISYKEYNLKITSIRLIEEKSISNKKIKCKTLSPIYIKDNKGKYVDIENKERFEEELNYISNLFLESNRGSGLKEKIKFTPIKMKKVVIKEEIRDFKEETNKKYIFINAYSGTFDLEGNVEDLNLLYKSALGFRRSEGFGLIDLV